MQIAINNTAPEYHFTYELTRHKLGAVMWGDRKSFHDLYERISQCWDPEPAADDRAVGCTYVGVISYFAYEVRHTFMGDRLAKLDGKNVTNWTDRKYRLFEDEPSRFQVGLDLPWPQLLFILESGWECFRNRKECPVDILQFWRDFAQSLSAVLQAGKVHDLDTLEPYFHGAIYGSNPYMMQAMEAATSYFLLDCRLSRRVSFQKLARHLECACYGTLAYQSLQKLLARKAKALHCRIEELSLDGDMPDVEL